MANVPYEVISSPFKVYITTGADAFTGILSTPSGGWTKLGTNGTRNQAVGGVTIQHSQTFNKIRTEGHTGPVKAVRTEEELMIRLTLLDLSKEVYSAVINGDTPAAQGTTGHDVSLSHGESTRELKLMVRGASPAANNRVAQFEVPRAYISSSPSVQFSKSVPAGIEFEFTALDDMTALATGNRFGRLTIAL